MSWTAPRTWTTNEVVTSSLLNTHIRDNFRSVPHPYDYSSGDTDVANTTTETSIYSKVITGNTLGTNGSVHLLLIADALFNNAAGDTLTLRVKFGGVTQITTEAQSLTIGASRSGFIGHVHLMNKGSASSQVILMESTFSTPGGAWDINLLSGIHGPATGSVDTTADQTFQITAQWSAASANNSFRKRVAQLLLAQN